MRRVRVRWSILLLVATLNFAAWARGRQPDDEEKDSFPDYNRLEIQHTHPAPDGVAAVVSSTPTPAGAVTPVVTFPPEDLSHPKPPPAVIPARDDFEPDLPQASSGTVSPAAH